MRTRLQPTPALHLQRMAGWGGARARASSVGLCGLQDRAGCCWDTQWGRGWHGDALRGTGALLGALHVHPNLGAMAFPEEPLHPSNLSTASLGQHSAGVMSHSSTTWDALSPIPCAISHPSLPQELKHFVTLKAMGAVPWAVPSCPTSQTTSIHWGLWAAQRCARRRVLLGRLLKCSVCWLGASAGMLTFFCA